MKRAVLVLAVALFALFLVRTSWVSDDAFITLRVVDNTVHGFGPRWNVAERVQAFTHPLWFLLLVPVYAVTREAYLTATLLCWGASLAGILVLARRFARVDAAVAAGLVAALALSRAFVDYSTSGLENPLTHLLLALFALAALDEERPGDRKLAIVAALGGLLATNRMDAVLFVAPVLGLLAVRARRARALAIVLAGFAPFLLWELFALIYYGSPWPNTALAKLNTGIPAGELAAQGVRYIADAVRNDPISPALILGGLAAASMRRRPLELALAAGIALDVLYVVKVGGDFMAGRFLAAPALLGAILVARAACALAAPARAALACAVLALGLVGTTPTLLPGRAYASRVMDLFRPHGIADERRYYFASAGLLNGAPGWTRPTPANRSVNKGHDLRRTRTALTVEGAVGYVGYYAGPSVHIVDYHALADPLLSRMPMIAADPLWSKFLRMVRPGETAGGWRIGHFIRAIPDGYLATLATGENRITDPAVRTLWERVARVTRGSIWSAPRWRDIAALAFSGGAPAARPPFREIPWAELETVAPGNPEASFQLGLDAFDAKDFDGAAARFEATLAKAPEHERALVRLGQLLLDRGDLARAERLIGVARSLAPHDPAAVGVAGDLAQARGRDDEAAALYLEAAALDPMSAGRLYGNIGILRALRGDFSAALEWFARAESVSPGDPQTAYNTGSAYARMGRIGEARAAFERALAADPRYEPARRALRTLSGGPG